MRHAADWRADITYSAARMTSVKIPESTASTRYLCPGCQRELPLCPARPTDVAILWACSQCDARFSATLVRDFPDDVRQRVRLVSFRINEEYQPKLPKLLDVAPIHPNDQRQEDRYPLVLPVPVLPLDSNLHPSGSLCTMQTRDISTSGVGLAHAEPVSATHLAVQLPGAGGSPIQTVVQVTHCSPVDNVWYIGGVFVRRLGD